MRRSLPGHVRKRLTPGNDTVTSTQRVRQRKQILALPADRFGSFGMHATGNEAPPGDRPCRH